MSGIIGKKIGMTSIYDANGKNIPCTIIEAGPCVITQVKTPETDGYSALQLGFEDQKESRVNKPKMGHFNKSKSTPKKKLVEFRDFEGDYNLGDSVSVDIFEEGEYVDVAGTSKGKGFQGVVKRYNFRGVGDATHGLITECVLLVLLVLHLTPLEFSKECEWLGRWVTRELKRPTLW